MLPQTAKFHEFSSLLSFYRSDVGLCRKEAGRKLPEKAYIAIDLKSFYASVECMERGLDPMTHKPGGGG